MKESCFHKFSVLLILIVFLWSFTPYAGAEDFGSLWGLVSDSNQNPIQNATISLSLKNRDFK
ncbi:MAG: hypothetical protein PVF66_06135, partial [Candidatus Aminicenantes bacterium]